MIDYEKEASEIVRLVVTSIRNGDGAYTAAESFLKDLSSRIREQTIEELIGRFQAKAEKYQAIGTEVGDGLACQQLDIADAIRSLKQVKP